MYTQSKEYAKQKTTGIQVNTQAKTNKTPIYTKTKNTSRPMQTHAEKHMKTPIHTHRQMIVEQKVRRKKEKTTN